MPNYSPSATIGSGCAHMPDFGGMRNAKLEKCLHWCAGLVLLLFAISHILYLLKNVEPTLLGENIVFPFITNKTLVIIVTLFEISVAACCFIYTATNVANLGILAFIAIISWYRWAFYFTGGRHCDCMGILGRVLHLNRTVESIIPIIALVCLFTATTPWIYKLWRRHLNKIIQLIVIGLGTSVFSGSTLFAQQNIELQGNYIIKNINYNTKVAIPGEDRIILFTATLCEDKWKIVVSGTNAGVGTSENLTYDGTNTCFTGKYSDYFADPSTESNQLFTSIVPSEIINLEIASNLGIDFPWIVFGLSPNAIEKVQQQSIPLPWLYPRMNPMAYGFRWSVASSVDSRFIKECKIIRDRSLDLKDEQELSRPEFDFPTTLAAKLDYTRRLQIRKQVLTGHVVASYNCYEWIHTNQLTMPKKATLYRYSYNPAPKYDGTPVYEYDLEVTNIVISPEPNNSPVLQLPAALTMVYDYRYRTSDTERIFVSASYLLHSNESWKSSKDEDLLKQASVWMEHGRKKNEFSKERNYVAWILLVAILAPIPIFLLIYKKTNKQKQI